MSDATWPIVGHCVKSMMPEAQYDSDLVDEEPMEDINDPVFIEPIEWYDLTLTCIHAREICINFTNY